MSLVQTSAPAVEPITLAEAKAHLRLDASAEDALVTSLILTSRLHIEAALGLALITQGWTYLRDRWPRSRSLDLPMRPIQAVTAIRVLAADGSFTTLDPTSYELDGRGLPARLVLPASASRPQPGRASNGIAIDFTAGWGDLPADVPAPIRQSLLLLVAHWYEFRAPFETGGAIVPIPRSVSDLLLPYRPTRL